MLPVSAHIPIVTHSFVGGGICSICRAPQSHRIHDTSIPSIPGYEICPACKVTYPTPACSFHTQDECMAASAGEGLVIKCGIGHDLQIADVAAILACDARDKVTLPCGCRVSAGAIQDRIREARRGAK